MATEFHLYQRVRCTRTGRVGTIVDMWEESRIPKLTVRWDGRAWWDSHDPVSWSTMSFTSKRYFPNPEVMPYVPEEPTP